VRAEENLESLDQEQSGIRELSCNQIFEAALGTSMDLVTIMRNLIAVFLLSERMPK
jgi:hypothetical protein